MTMTKPTSEQVTFLAAGAGATQRTALDKFRDAISVKDFGATGNGTTDDSGAIETAITAALAGGRVLYFPNGQYRIATAKTFEYTGDLFLYGDNATLLLNSVSVVPMTFQPPLAATTTLSASVNDGARSVSVTSTSGMAVGQMIVFETSTPVDAIYGYVKRSIAIIGEIVGNTVYLSEPLNFGFTTAETTVTTRSYASLKMSGINIVQSVFNNRFDFRNLQDCELSNAEIKGYSQFLGNVAFFTFCYGIVGENLKITNGLYPVMIAGASRHGRFRNVFAKDALTPFDINTWAYDVRISNMHAVNVYSSIQCHPCFEVYYEDVTEYLNSAASNGLVLRCIGGGATRCTQVCGNTTVNSAAQGPFLLSAYQYLGQKYDRIYDQVVAPFAELGGSDVRTIYVNDCTVKNVNVDGSAQSIGQVSINSGTVTTDRLRPNRVTVLSPDGPRFVDSPTETFASIDVIKDITGITQANPAVVTAVAHGFSNGDLVQINGVVGMTEVNTRTFTIANVATDTFELVGENSSGYAAYVSGGKATKGRLAKTYDPLLTPGSGWYPFFNGGMRLRKTGATIAPGTSITIPVKIINSVSTAEETVRNTSITIRAVSDTDGCASVVYQAFFFTATTTVGTLSSGQNALPAIGTLTAAISNFRPHYGTQQGNEAIPTSTAGLLGQSYFSFDLVVTASATSDRIQYVDVNFSEVRCGQLT